MNTAEWATSVGIQPVTCPDHDDCRGLADHPLPSERYGPMPATHKPDDDADWASDRDCDQASRARYGR